MESNNLSLPSLKEAHSLLLAVLDGPKHAYDVLNNSININIFRVSMNVFPALLALLALLTKQYSTVIHCNAFTTCITL